MGNKDMLKVTTATNLLLRLFIGGFLIYMAYEIMTSLDGATKNNVMVLTGFSIFFVICGLGIGGNSLYRLIRHQYYDPMSAQSDGDLELSENTSQDDTEKEEM